MEAGLAHCTRRSATLTQPKPQGQPTHLLLVDPAGQVRTADMAFDSVSHLINYPLRARLPIVSKGR